MTDKHDSAKEASTAEHDNTSARRRFLGKAAKVAVTTSAVTLMLSAGAKRGVAGLYGFNEWH